MWNAKTILFLLGDIMKLTKNEIISALLESWRYRGEILYSIPINELKEFLMCEEDAFTKLLTLVQKEEDIKLDE